MNRSLRSALVLVVLAPCLYAAEPRLINGTVVPDGQAKEIIKIRSGTAGCTATVVGPRVILTASHCVRNSGATATFTVGGQEYQATVTRHPQYTETPEALHDVAIGITNKDIQGVEYVSVGGTASIGLEMILYGYGCIQPGGNDTPDGKLRMGSTIITQFRNGDLEMVSQKANGAALCYGDSGGPAILMINGKKVILGINSKGNIQNRNINARLDIADSKNFLMNVAQQQSVKICGLTEQCGTVTDPPPTCVLSALPPKIKKQESVTIKLEATGNVTEAKINGTVVSKPVGQISVAGTTVGTFTATGEVTGPGGKNTCTASYEVEDGTPPPPPPAPTCTLQASPPAVKIGETITLTLRSVGEAREGTIDGVNVSLPTGTRTITGQTQGTFTATGRVSGPGGSNQCLATYQVNGTDPLPTPNFAVVPTYCGNNSESSTVARVCLGVVKRDVTTNPITIAEVLQVQYQDGTKEVLPILHRRVRPKEPNDPKTEEDLITYANRTLSVSAQLTLDTRYAILTKINDVPTTLMGRSGSEPGQYFIVNQLGNP